jgi:hypothetical protein
MRALSMKRSAPALAGTLALLAISVTAHALEFRGVALGDTCRQAAQREVALGAHPMQDMEKMIQSGSVVFEDKRVAEQRSQITYTCARPAGTVTSYVVAITTRREAHARDLLAKAKAATVKKLGLPYDDSEFAQATEKLRQLRLKGATTIYVFIDWKAPDHQAVNLALEKPQDSPDWSVTTTVGPESAAK